MRLVGLLPLVVLSTLFALPCRAAEPDGMTPLLHACESDDTAAARELIAAGADVSQPNHYGVTPLFLACRNGNAVMLKLLLDAGADPQGRFSGGETALMVAARTGRLDSVRLLVERGADIEAKELRGQTAMMWAANQGNREVVDYLLEKGADFKTRLDSGFSAFFFAIRQGHSPIVRSFIHAGADVNEPAMPEKGGGKMMRRGTAALMLAVENGHFELAMELVAAGADPNDQRSGFTPLHAITYVRKTQRGDGDDGVPPPAGSGKLSSLDFVAELVKHGADVNARLVNGTGGGGGKIHTGGATPFLLAAQTADLPLLHLLKRLGADPNIGTAKGTLPIHVAAGVGVPAPGEEPGTEEEAMEAVIYLLEHGADINAVDQNGETVMHGAAYKSVPEMFRLLDSKGANIAIWNRKNKFGWTPLLIAQGYRQGNFRPIAEMEAAVSEVMRARGIDPPPAPDGKP